MLGDKCKWLEYCYNVLNDVYFEGKLPPVVITMMSSKGTYGHITVKKVWNNSGEYLHELNITAEYLHRRVENLLCTLVHEQTHLYCMENNISDTSKSGKYHNKNFKIEAEKRDLEIGYQKYIGYSVTFPTERFIQVIKQNGLYDIDLNCYRTGGVGESVAGGSSGGGGDDNGGNCKPKSSTRKYVCHMCGNSVRATKDVNIGCLDCGIAYEKV